MSKKTKKCVCLILTLAIMLVGFPISAHATPAPSLRSIQIFDLTLDEYNEIHIAVKIIGTASTKFCYCNGNLCKENYNEGYTLFSGGVGYGEVCYYRTGIYFNSNSYGRTINARFEATNACSPWNEMSTSQRFTIPDPDARR